MPVLLVSRHPRHTFVPQLRSDRNPPKVPEKFNLPQRPLTEHVMFERVDTFDSDRCARAQVRSGSI